MRRRKKLGWLVGVAILALVLGSCAPQATPTPVDEGPIRTSAVSTFVAELTQTAEALAALATPTFTPEPATSTPAATAATPTVGAGVTGTAAVASCDNSQYVSDVTVPDGTVMQPGEKFTKTWNVKNSGTCAWTTSYSIVYGGYSDKLSGKTTALTTAVPAGQTSDISIDLVAPTKSGTYVSAWRLANAQNFPFGQFLTVVIVVK
jgi:hypothetical protein